MMDEITPKLRELEDRFQEQAQLATYCRIVESTDEDTGITGPGLEVVFPMNQELKVYRFLRQNRQWLRSAFGADSAGLLRTILHHLAHEQFGTLSSDEKGFFVSTNFRNLQAPYQLEDQAGRSRLEYDVDVVVVAVTKTIEPLSGVSQEIRQVALRFNEESRFLKIAKLRVAFTDSKFVVPGQAPLNYESLGLCA